MKSVDPKIYTKDFYLNACLGAEEFKKSNGKKLHWRVLEILKKIEVKPNDVVLDIGCGRGDITLNLAAKCRMIYGIDYAAAAITLANEMNDKYPRKIKDKVKFLKMNAKKLDFTDNTFDVIIAIDVFEHLYDPELRTSLKEMKRVLKPNGILFIHTGTNRLLYDIAYKYYIRSLNLILTKIDQFIKRKSYNPMPKDPRTVEEKEQHVNEPTYRYLKNLLDEFKFQTRITGEVGYVKEGKSIRTKLYNLLVTLYPISKYYPLNTLFYWAFICRAKNIK